MSNMSSTFTSAFMATATALTVASSTAVAPMATAAVSGEEEGECELLGPFAIIIQGALGLLALLSLVFKRWRERPQRPVKIWFFDASKQVVGSILLHMANLLMSMLSSGALTVSPSKTTDDYSANPCSFYLLNLGIDTTLGIPVLIVLLRVLTIAASKTPLANPPESIRSGNYGEPPKAIWWLKQCLIYFIGLLGMKLCVFVLFKICPWIVHVGDWALRWTEGNQAIQIAFVMLIFPVIMNAMQYYIIDGFIKNKDESGHQPIPTEDMDEDDADRIENWNASFESDEEEEDVKKTTTVGSDAASSSRLRASPHKDGEYNPAKDGTVGTSAGSSNSVDKENVKSLLGR